MSDAVLTDPQGRRVELADDTWARHITVVHRELSGHRAVVEAAIETPIAICESGNRATHPTGIQYFGHCDRDGLYIMVATEEVTDTAGTRRIVKTAHFVKRLGIGSKLWP